MSKNEMMVYKENESFVGKIKKFFRKLFGIKEKKILEENEKIQVSNEEIKTTSEENNFMDSIKIQDKQVEGNKEDKMNALLYELNNNPETLEKISIDNLKKMEKYYDDLILRRKERLRKLKEVLN